MAICQVPLLTVVVCMHVCIYCNVYGSINQFYNPPRTHTCAALNVLVFNGGRIVKLADFGTAVQLSEISAVGGKIAGCTPYFAAPEVRILIKTLNNNIAVKLA